MISLFVACILGSGSVFASSVSAPVEKALSSLPDWKSHTTIYIASGPDTVLFENQGTKSFIPASVTKLTTAATTLKNFLPGTRMKTQVLSVASVTGDTIKGDLILKGGGDPSFVSENMWVLVNQLARTGVRKIEGDIIVDDHLFDTLRFDPSRQKERVDRAYDAPTGAMSFNWNSVNVFVRPGAAAGDAARVFLDPENEYTDLKSEVITVKAGADTSVQVDRDETKTGDKLIVRGKIAADSKEIAIFKNITKPDLWAGAQLRGFMLQRGITLSGQVKSGVAPREAKVLSEVESKPIEQILGDMNKFSNNYVAEMLAKNLSTLRSTPGSISGGMELINEYMKGLGLTDSEYKLLNPSGLTRENRLSAHALWKVLWDMKSQMLYEPEFLTSLPIAGIDGTLKKRMKGTPAERWVRAKTGFLTGVVSLAGFAGRLDGQIIPFVLIYNGSADENKVRSTFDHVATVLVK